jgi:hypothetical protein
MDSYFKTHYLEKMRKIEEADYYKEDLLIKRLKHSIIGYLFIWFVKRALKSKHEHFQRVCFTIASDPSWGITNFEIPKV